VRNPKHANGFRLSLAIWTLPFFLKVDGGACPMGTTARTAPAVQAPWPGRIGESCKKSESF
jgi:hypothetical protein